MEINLLQRRKVLEEKIPEIEKTIAMVDYLVENQESDEPIYVDYELNDTLYAKAKVESTGTVYLWLGVSLFPSFNTTLSYTHGKRPM